MNEKLLVTKDTNKDSFKINLCDFMKGFVQPFNSDIDESKHYSWCPESF